MLKQYRLKIYLKSSVTKALSKATQRSCHYY